MGDWIDAAIDRLLHAGRQLGRVNALIVSFALLAVVSGLDVAMGSSVQLTAAYIFGPIVTAWCVTRRDGALMAVLTAIISTIVHASSGSVSLQPLPFAATLLIRIVTFSVLVLLVSQVRVTTERYEHLSARDALTGLLNRGALCERLEAEIVRSQRYRVPISILFADVDDFKGVNDRLGHPEGDRFLVDIAGALSGGLRPTDLIGRMGGDEFAVVLPETEREGAEALLTRLHERLGELEKRYGTGLSVGLAAFDVAPESCEQALASADVAMYAVKGARRAAASAAMLG